MRRECVRQSKICPPVPEDLRSFPGAARLSCETIQCLLCNVLLCSFNKRLVLSQTAPLFRGGCVLLHINNSGCVVTECVKHKDNFLHLCSFQWTYCEKFANAYLQFQLSELYCISIVICWSVSLLKQIITYCVVGKLQSWQAFNQQTNSTDISVTTNLPPTALIMLQMFISKVS